MPRKHSAINKTAFFVKRCEILNGISHLFYLEKVLTISVGQLTISDISNTNLSAENFRISQNHPLTD